MYSLCRNFRKIGKDTEKRRDFPKQGKSVFPDGRILGHDHDPVEKGIDRIPQRGDIQKCLDEAGFESQNDVYTSGALRFSCTNDKIHVFRLVAGDWMETWSLTYEDIKFDRFRRFVRLAVA